VLSVKCTGATENLTLVDQALSTGAAFVCDRDRIVVTAVYIRCSTQPRLQAAGVHVNIDVLCLCLINCYTSSERLLMLLRIHQNPFPWDQCCTILQSADCRYSANFIVGASMVGLVVFGGALGLAADSKRRTCLRASGRGTGKCF
jgi:hypothetical protein